MDEISDKKRSDRRKRIVEIADRRPNFISDRTAAAIEKATWEVCQRIQVKEKNSGSNESTHQANEDNHD